MHMTVQDRVDDSIQVAAESDIHTYSRPSHHAPSATAPSRYLSLTRLRLRLQASLADKRVRTRHGETGVGGCQ